MSNIVPTERRFTAYGKEIVISPAYDFYNSLQRMFMSEAMKAAENFMGKYEGYGNIDTFADRGHDDGLRIIADVVERLAINDILIGKKIYDIDLKHFFSDYYLRKYYFWDKACDDVMDRYMAIKLTQQQLDEYRMQRRENRDRWVGMGYGIGGAIKASMKAGAMNMASGMAHSLFNAGAKAISSADEASQKSALYKNKKNTIRNGIYLSVYTIHRACWDILSERGLTGSGRVNCIISDEIERAEAITGNFPRMSRDDAINIFPEVLLLSPYDKNMYKNVFSILGDRDGELEKIAEYFGVSGLSDIKKERVESLFSSLKPSLSVSEEEAIKAKQIFIEKTELYGPTESRKKYLAEIDEVLADYDVKARTVAEFTMETREEANEARQELAHIKELLNGLDYENSEADAAQALKKLESDGNQSAFIVKYIDKMRALLDNFDKNARSVVCGGNPVLFDTREEAERVRGIQEVQEAEKSYQKALKKPEEFENLAALLRKNNIPTQIRESYIALVNDFKESQKEVIADKQEEGSIKPNWQFFVWGTISALGFLFIERYWESWTLIGRVSAIVAMFYSSGMLLITGGWLAWVLTSLGGLLFITRSWDSWAGLGKGLSIGFMCFAPIVSLSEAINNRIENIGQIFVSIYWLIAIGIFAIPSWGQLSWIGWKSIIIIIAVISILILCVAIGEHKKNKKAKRYLKGLEKFNI